MIQLKNRWTDEDETWYGRYAIGDYPKIVLFNSLQSENTNMADEQTCEVHCCSFFIVKIKHVIWLMCTILL
jgi:hypothetical protein